MFQQTLALTSLLLGLVASSPVSVASSPLVARDGWKIPSTSFDSQTTFNKYWSYNYPWGTDHNGAARMSPSKVSVGGGKVTLVADLTSGLGGSLKYLSGTIYAKEYFTVAKAGGYDISGQFLATTTKGTWPAFWMTGTTWPPEIDLAEWKGSGKVSFNTFGMDGVWSAKDVTYSSPGSWHTMKFELRDLNGVDVQTKFYLDGKLQATQTGKQMVGKQMWLIMDLQMEGSSGAPGPTSRTTFALRNFSVYSYNG